jgi:predicted extracellular nuclease
MRTPFPKALTILVTLAASSFARELSVVSYNVENLFDPDAVANYEDFTSGKYTPDHLRVKAQNIARVLANVDAGKGPDIILFHEIEIDQTPESTVPDVRAWLDAVKDKKIDALLAESPLPKEIAGIPSEVWLQKACEDAGLTGYHVVTANEKPGIYEEGRPRTVQNVVFSRFPVLSQKVLSTSNARSILEVTVDVDGHPLTVFANHWKSGAGDAECERDRLLNAATLRTRLDEIFKENPLTDVIIGGDFNSHYDQKSRYPEMAKTGIIDVLGSQGNELALRTEGSDLYNLWFELPADKRGSDIYHNEWGTLMHLLVSRGLYNNEGLQYKDNSFEVLRIPSLNADVFGRPIRFSRGSRPSGFSDHFPLLARFQVAEPNAKDKWMPLDHPSTEDQGTGRPVPLVTSTELFKHAIHAATEPETADFRDGSYEGKIFCVEAPATVDDKGRVHIKLRGRSYDVFSHDKKTLALVREKARAQGSLHFYGQIGTFRDRWQFVLADHDWLL